MNGDDIQAIVQIIPEIAGFRGFLEILVGGGQDPDIRLYGPFPPTRSK